MSRKRNASKVASRTRHIPLLLGALAATQLGAAESGAAEGDDLSLSDLMNITVESVSKRSESLIAAPSAVYVVTSDDIKRYGITRLQDALRLVPGVVQVDKGYFSSEFNIREDLVEVPTTVSFQLDGVPIQNPLFGAVFFRGLELPIEEIDRIEVIRGNGGTVYGANSVTGVVSIYTKKAANSKGFAVSVGGGGPGHAKGALRMGSSLPIGEKTDWSMYGSVGTNRGYDADKDEFSGDSVWANGKNAAKTADSSYWIANKFSSNEPGKPIQWNAMFSTQTEWNKKLKTSLRLYGRGMEDKAYAKKAYPYLTLAQAQAKVAPTVIPKVLAQFITDPTDLQTAALYLATGNNTALATLMIGKGYVRTDSAVGTVLAKYIGNNPAAIQTAAGFLATNDNVGFVTYMLTNGFSNGITDPTTFGATFQGEVATLAMTPVVTALTNAMTAALTPVLSTPPSDSAWVTDVHYRSFIGNLRTDVSFSDNHQFFANINGTINDNKYSEYQFGVISPNNWSLELEAQDILNFELSSMAKAEWITGGDIRYVDVNIGESQPAGSMLFEKPQTTEWLRSAFVQGKVTLWDKLDLIAGIKGEQWTLVNDDIQWLPSARIAYKPLDNFTVWSAISKGSTVPGYTQTRMQALQVPLPAYAPGLLPEVAWGKWVATTRDTVPAKPVDYMNLEGGARWQNRNTMVDVTGYFMQADGRILTSSPILTKPIVSTFSSDSIVPAYFANIQDAQLWGVEAMVRNRPLSWLSGEASYAYRHTEITKDLSDSTRVGTYDKSPEHIVKARTSLDLPANFTLSVDGEYYTSYKFLQTVYDFVQQKYDATGTSPNTRKLQDNGGRESLVHLNATLNLALMDKKLNLQVYGKNLAAWQWGYEAYDYQGTHPEKTAALYGANASWGF